MKTKEPTILQRHQAWMRRWRESGKPIARYDCPNPNCGKRIECPRPEKNQDAFDSAATCPHCESLHFKVVPYSGAVKVFPM